MLVEGESVGAGRRVHRAVLRPARLGSPAPRAAGGGSVSEIAPLRGQGRSGGDYDVGHGDAIRGRNDAGPRDTRTFGPVPGALKPGNTRLYGLLDYTDF